MSIADFMAAAVAQEPNKAYAAFDAEIGSRIEQKIEDKRVEVTNRIFNSESVGVEETTLDETSKPEISSISPEAGRKGSYDIIDKNGKVIKSYPYTKEGKAAALDHFKKLK